MFRTKMVYVILAAAIATVSYFGWKLTARTAYESAEYRVIESDGPFTIREYPTLMMATTNMRSQSQGNDGSFSRLFRYISGSNDMDQKVAMTTPVFMQPDQDESSGQMGFVLPKSVAEGSIPEPTDDDVKIQAREGGRYAALRFNGRMDAESLAEAEERLRNWMKGRSLTGGPVVESAGYDPPWTPGPMRRNEVLIRVR